MFEEFQEAAEKEQQRRKMKQLANIVTGVLFSISLLLLTMYTD